MTNKQILILFFILLTMALLTAIGTSATNSLKASFFAEFQFEPVNGFELFFLQILTGIVLFNNLIPISLVVTMEVVKVYQASLINSDLDMYYERFDTPAVCRTSSLVEELGQIDYVFSVIPLWY